MGNCCGNSNTAKYVETPSRIMYIPYSLHRNNPRREEEIKANTEEHKIESLSDLYDEIANLSSLNDQNEERINFTLYFR